MLTKALRTELEELSVQYDPEAEIRKTTKLIDENSPSEISN